MTSPEGRLRCGRPSAFVPAILPPPINSNFGASPTLFYPLSLPPLRPTTPRPVLSVGEIPLVSLLVYTLFRSNLTSCFFVHMSHRPCLDGISFILLPLRLSFDAAPFIPARILYLGFVCDCGSGACQALLYVGGGSNDA